MRLGGQISSQNCGYSLLPCFRVNELLRLIPGSGHKISWKVMVVSADKINLFLLLTDCTCDSFQNSALTLYGDHFLAEGPDCQMAAKASMEGRRGLFYY